MTSYWNEREELILIDNYHRVPLDRLSEMLPRRSRGAIIKRAKDLKLNNFVMPQKSAATSLEALKLQVAIKEAQLAVESTSEALNIFDEQIVLSFNGGGDPNEFIKHFTHKRSKLVAAFSRAKLKLVIARMREKCDA